jgi:hypothetical protein
VQGLTVNRQFLKLILGGTKTWEIRGRPCNKREIVALIESGSSHIVGQVRIVDSLRIVSVDEFNQHASKHGLGDRNSELPYTTTYAWVLEDPVPYTGTDILHVSKAQGAIIFAWLNRPPAVVGPAQCDVDTLWPRNWSQE